MTETQKKTLFANAHLSSMIAADYANYLDHGSSFVMELLRECGLSSREALVFFAAIGEKETGASEAYFHCFEVLDIEKEFDDWSSNEDVEARTRQQVEDAVYGMVTGQTGYH